jgi:hypothetical protein
MNIHEIKIKQLKTEYFLNGACLVALIWVIIALVMELQKYVY